jgi:hypothetical protein
MPAIDLSILNQRQTPAFYADTLANRPSAGFIGRIFVSTNTFEFYRDNGTTWDLIGGPGTSTVTGTGANGQVTYWNGTSSITGSNDLFFDAVNGHFGVGTITPGTALDVKHNQNTVVQLEQETATNDTRIAFINSGVGLWRLGAFYNAGANDFGIYDVVGAIQPVTVKKTTGQVLIGTSTVGSGKLVVASSTGDNGVQIVGASAPSLRIDNAETGPTKRAGLGISTATNNFIQGSADGDFCMFNGSTTASPILFGVYDAGTTNVQEAARISAARNLLIGTTTDNGNKLQVTGTSTFSSSLTITAAASTLFMSLRGRSADNFGFIGFYNNTGATRYGYIQSHSANGGQLNITADGGAQIIGDSRGLLLQPTSGNVGIGTSTPAYKLTILDGGGASVVVGATTGNAYLYADDSAATVGTITSTPLRIATNSTERARFSPAGNLLIKTTTDNGATFQVNGSETLNGTLRLYDFIGATSNYWECYQYNDNTLRYNYNGSGGDEFILFSNGDLQIANGGIKTASPSGGSAQFWRLGNYTAGVAVQAGKVRVEINGVAYDLLTA